MTRLALLLAVPLLATACGDTNPPGVVAADAARDSYTISVAADDKSPATTWRLTCEPAGGDHPDPTAACDALEKAADPFGPVEPDTACTEIYGGPETATITGTRNGAPVEAKYSRINGCEISRWDAIAAVIPGAVR
ncbi:MAG TPA: SSI family serine proteinase inhibitor [Mycobacteriales bacterium]|nr:SSI family serine proteinase inhibitor [Mycobacteriales bacterium]